MIGFAGFPQVAARWHDVVYAVRRTARAAASRQRRPATHFAFVCALRRLRPETVHTHASASPAAEAISDKGRSRRRSVKNRRPFDCFKSAAGIRFSAGAVADPEIVSPRRFLGYLLSAQKVTYKDNKEIATRRVVRAAASPRGGPLAFAKAHSRSPQAATRKLSHYDACGFLNRAVRRRPTAADCNSQGSCMSSAVGEQHAKN